MASTSANTNAEMAQTYLQPSAASQSNQDDEYMSQFGAILAQIKIASIAPLASSVRRKIQARHSKERTKPSGPTDNTVIDCKVLPVPLRGSYNLAYCVLFNDGVKWILKVPADGSYARFDRLAADALTSEALTMRLIKRSTTIPVPTVYSFDTSLNNDVGCPYILMDFLQGKPLYEGWFDPEASSAKCEQFRARALQTIAGAMVQLNAFTLDRGGALRFDSAGQPVDVAGAKMHDVKAYDDCADEGFCPEHDVWCENGPTTDPSSYLLFTLNRRGYKNKDSAYTSGAFESARLFTQWALELSDNIGHEGQKFVLAHPDFDFHNILVNDDGTLLGILDWDGVAAVPLSVGCLRYPNWLIRDWDPVNYNWNVEADEPKSYSGLPENTPDELVCYRAMYAQFIEMLLPINSVNGRPGTMGADITRMSLITGSLEVAINRPEATGQMMGHLFREIKRIVGEENNTELSDTASSGSNVGPDLSDTEHSATDTLVSSPEMEAKDSDEKAEWTGIEEAVGELSGSAKGTNSESLAHECSAILHQFSPRAADDAKAGTDLSALDVTSRKTSGFEEHGDSRVPLSNSIPAKEAPREHKAPGSEKARVAESDLSLGEKSSEGTAEVLSKKESVELKSRQKFRAVKWALGLGVKGCKEASKAFHKKEKASGPGPKDRTATTSPQADSQSDSQIAMSAISLCNRTEALLRSTITQMHREKLPGLGGPNPKENGFKRYQVIFKWLTGFLKTMIHKPVKSDVEGTEIPTIAETLPQEVVLADTGHCQKRNLGEEKNLGRVEISGGNESADSDFDDVWACIAAGIDKGGIPIDMIKKYHHVIVQSVTNILGREAEREKEEVLYSNNCKAPRKVEKAREQTGPTNANNGNNQAPFQHQDPVKSTLAEPSLETRAIRTDSAQIDSSKGWVSDVVGRGANIAHKNVVAPFSGVESIVSGEAKKPGSAKRQHGKAANPSSSIKGITSDAIGPEPIRLSNNNYRVSQLESLILKLEAAKKRFNVERALKEQNSESANLIPRSTDSGSVQLEDPKQQTSTNNSAAPEATAEANQKLRKIILGFSKPRAADTRLKSNRIEAAKENGAAPMQLGDVDPGTLRLGTMSSADIEIANQKLKTILSSLQKPEAVDANLQPNVSRIAEDAVGVSERNRSAQKPYYLMVSAVSQNTAGAQIKAAFKVGQWFETPRGSLKRIESEKMVDDCFNNQETISRSSSHFLDNERVTSEPVVASREHKELAKVSRFQRLFPNASKSAEVKVPQLPDIHEGIENDEELAQNNDDVEGEVHNEQTSLVGSVQGHPDGKPANRVSADIEDSESPNSEKTVDLGNFNMSEVCVALGNGNLDEKRMRKLEGGFKMILAEALGRV